MKLESIMNRYFRSVPPSAPLTHAYDEMIRGNFRHLPVLDATDNTLVGILTEGDIARYQARMGESIWSNPEDPVERAMTPTVQTAGPDDSVNEAAARMAAGKISCLPITKLGKVIGLVTLTDVLAAEVRAKLGVRPSPGPFVSDVMTRSPLTVHPNDPLLDAAARMAQYNVRHLPVVNGEKHVLGMLSDVDVRAIIGDPGVAFTDEGTVSASRYRVRDAMSRPAFMANARDSCMETARSMVDKRASAVPVVDSQNELIGIVSYVDLLRGFADLLSGGSQGQPATH